MSETKLYIAYNHYNDDILGAFKSKYLAFERIFTHWKLDEEIEDEDLIDEWEDYRGGQELGEYAVVKVNVDEPVEINFNMGYGDKVLTLPETFQDLLDYLKVARRDEKIQKIIE